MTNTTYNEIVALSIDHISFEETHRGHIKMKHKPVPLSIKQAEFEYIRNTIVTCGLKRGLEIGTAFGISTLAGGLGFHATGGKLLSMDAYIEEHYEDAGLYRFRGGDVFENSEGYGVAKFLLNHFGVSDAVELRCGWSPTDVEKLVRDVHGDTNLDYVFIDGGHFTEQIIEDVRAVAPLLDEDFVVVFHDVYETFTPIYEEIENLLGVKLEVVIPNPLGENLGIASTYAINST